jgi:hypothetical protein
MPIILPTWEAEIRRIEFEAIWGKKVCETPISALKSQAWW